MSTLNGPYEGSLPVCIYTLHPPRHDSESRTAGKVRNGGTCLPANGHHQWAPLCLQCQRHLKGDGDGEKWWTSEQAVLGFIYLAAEGSKVGIHLM